MQRRTRIATTLLALDGDDVTIGPTHSTSCFQGRACMKGGLAWVDGSDLWIRAGVATYAAGLLLAAVCVLLGAAIASGRIGRLPAKLSIVAAITAVGATAAFVATFPALTGASMGRGLVLMGAGVAAAIAAAVLTLRAAPPE